MVSNLASIPGYRISEELYNGSRTLVYRGYRETDSLPVVIKLLKNPYPGFSELVQFRNQYTIAKNLNSPLIIATYSLEPYQNGYALVMEDFGGISLKDYFTRVETLYATPLKEFLEIAIALCNALDILYRERIIHKDIKPSNILINPQTKQVKLIDFSIASLLPRETQTLINPNVLEGTLAYISPEQTGRMNRGIDYRTDFYSLGVTFYELLTGELPFPSNDPMELVHCHIAKVASLGHEINPEIPPVFSEIVKKLMAKNAEDRYQSALGLKFDLQNCLTQLQETGKIESFEIGKRDISDRFIIPDKLYGRETEVSTLLQAFERISLGVTEMILVAGFSGIGKTAVVNEVHKPIVRQRGYFIKGKFDQFNRNIPLSAFVQVFRDLMGQLLSESDTELHIWKTQILQAIGDNGQVIIEVIPELERIIGKQAPATELSGTAAQNRFNLLFQKFIQVFTTIEHPLVMFLDDLQWADSASLNLIQLLMNESESGYLLMIGAYRDNEVSSAHPLMLTLDAIAKANATINTITLGSLSQGSLNKLVADTLNCHILSAQALTELIALKTKGNPFFATQFLKALYQDGLIQFDLNLGHWQCDLAEVRTVAMSDDVVEFMASQLQKLPNYTQDILKLAACIGAQFDLKTLAIVSQQSESDAAVALWKAVQSGLILPQSEIYKFYVGELDTTQNIQQVSLDYKFLHDRVQQAAYSLIPDDQKQATHLLIARLLRQNTSDAELEANVFEIVNHWNRAIALVIDSAEKDNLVQLNLIAGRKAKASTAYEPALDYFQTGLTLLCYQGWQRQPKLILALQSEAAEAAYLCGNFAQMEQWVSEILAQKLNPLDYVKAYEVQIQAYSSQSRYHEAVAIARTALKSFNIHLPEQPTPADIAPALQEVTELLNGRTALELLDLPVMTAAEPLAIMQLLSSMTGAAYRSAPLLFPFVVLLQVKLSIQQGNTALSAYGYSGYATLLSSILEDLDAAYEFGQLGLQLVAKFNSRTIRAKVNITVGVGIMHCKSHARGSLPLFMEAFQIGLEVGELEFAAHGVLNLCQYAYLIGKNLSTLVTETEPYLATLLKLNQTPTSTHCCFILYQIQRLEGNHSQTELAASLEQLHTGLTVVKDSLALHYYWVYQLTTSYLLNEMAQAMQAATQAGQTLAAGASQITIPTFYFYDSLIALAAYSTASDKTVLLDRVTANQAKLHHRAYHAPMNFQHKYDLVEAEQHRVLGNKAEAIEFYDRAISGAKANEYIQEEALANELAAKFYLDWGKQGIAGEYMIEAYYCYVRWGAKAKVADLEKRYAQLLAPILQQIRSPVCTNETVFALGSVTSTCSPTTSSSLSVALDLAAILKASQTISGEIELEKLLASLLEIVIENAGADKCVLMLLRDDHLLIKGLITVGTEPVVLQRILVEDSQDIPLKLIYKVLHNRQTVVLIDVSADLTLANDPYIMRQQPKSILCSPILHQGKLLGIVYLENKLAEGAFTSDRVELLNLLCAQAAISLENARLYAQEQEKSQSLQASLEQLNQSEARAQQLFEQSTDPLCLFSPRFGFFDCNHALLNLFGYTSKDQFLLLHPSQISPEFQPDGQLSFAKAEAIIKNALQKSSNQFEWVHQRANGENFWAEITQTIIPHKSETILHTVIRDISDHKLAEFQIQRQAQADQLLANIAQSINQSVRLDLVIEGFLEQVRQFFHSDRVLICRFDANYNVVIELEMLSQPELSILGQTIVDPCFDQTWAERYSQGYITACNDSQASDITPCYAEFLAQMQVQANLTVGILGNDQILGLIIVHHCYATHVWQQSEIDLLKQLGLQIGIAQQKANLYTQLQAELTERRLAEIALQQALLDLQQAQLQIVQSEKMSALGNLVAGVAHEINNPVGCIIGNVGAVQDSINDLFGLIDLYNDKFPQPGAEIAEELETIDLEYLRDDLPKLIRAMKDGGDRIKSISKSLRTFSRADSDQKQTFNLHEGIDSTILILRHRLKASETRPAIEVVTNYGNIPAINCFPGQLNQVFMNILANAIDALDESNNGRSFEEIKANPNCITITTSVENHLVKIAILDNGKGMSESVKQKIFDHLFTTKGVGKGTGLGLAIAQSIVVEKHGGTLNVNSTLGEGTEFVITLPILAQ